MKAVVDTNVIASLFVNNYEYSAEARSFFACLGEACAPASWQAELTNVLWMNLRHRRMSVDEAVRALECASVLDIESVPVLNLWGAAIIRAHESGLAAYNSLFVELAASRGIPLATFDRAILKAFPKIAARPAALVGSST